MKSKLLSALVAAAFAIGAAGAQAQISDGVIKIGVMNDMSGLYADITGPGSVVAARMAIEDFGAAAKGMKVEVLGADHQNKPDVGSTIARTWYDVDKVDVIVDVPTSSVALAINQLTREKGKAFLVSGAATADLTGKACSPNTIHWTYDTWMLANGTGSRDRQDRRRQLVLPDRRLRLRPRARARHRGGGAQGRRQGAGQGAPPVPGHRLQLVPAAGAGVEGQGHRAGQRRRRHHQQHQAGGRVRHRQGRAEPRRHAGVHHRRARPGPAPPRRA